MKWLGAALLIAASYLCGEMISHEEKKKLIAVDSLISLLYFMQRKMISERMPLYEIFNSFSDGYLEQSGFLPLIRSHRTETNRLWEEAIRLLPLENDIISELERFGRELGRLALDEQEKRTNACAELLNRERDKLKSALPAKQKSARAVSLLIGMMAAILLL